jgi:enoyl-CoA hydratase/carnithine racemase
MSEFPLVLTRVEDRGEAGRVAYITINIPERRNALGTRAKEALAAAFHALVPDQQLRVAVLTGAGDQSFIGGADVKEMSETGPKSPRDMDPLADKTHLACDIIRELPVPVIARINGYCIGAGMEIAASCDLRVGVTTARFAMPEVKFGLVSNKESCLLPGLIGWGKTRELVLTGEFMDAQEAWRVGFLQKLVSAAELDAAVEQWVASICAAGPVAVREQKKLARDWEQMSISDAIRQGLRVNARIKMSEEPRRLARQFMERKKKS